MTQQLKDHSLKQLNSTYLAGLKPDELLHLSKKLLHDLKEARDRLNQNSGNSSKPPGSRAPWEALPGTKPAGGEPEHADVGPDAVSGAEADGPPLADDGPAPPPLPPAPPAAKRKQGKQPGAQGYGRTWPPPIGQTSHHQASACAACGASLTGHVPYTAYDSVDIQWGDPAQPGLTVLTTRHILYGGICACGHCTRDTPHQHAADPHYYPKTDVAEWRLIGPKLASLVVHLRLRCRMSVRGSQAFLHEVLGIPLSVGALQQCFVEAAASAAPLEDALVAELLGSAGQDGGIVLHADETSWKERGELLWLWAFTTTLTVCFWVGHRTREMFDNVLGGTYGGWLMSDGYGAYRHYPKRLRCWAHLIRKARGLEECLDGDARAFGKLTLAWMGTLQAAIYGWREAGGTAGLATGAIRAQHQAGLAAFRAHCTANALSPHDKTAALAKEFINDWDAIFRTIDHPWLPLTNNDAERALRHWVILRKTNHGTKSAIGSRALALLASIIGTCRLRGASSLAYLADVIGMARAGQLLPALPTKVGV